MIERVVLELDHESGEWTVRPDKGQPVTGLGNLWEAGQVASGLDAQPAPGRKPATPGRSRRRA